MKKLLACLILLMSMNATAQDKKTYDVSKDTESDQVVFNGKCSYDDLSREPTFSWMRTVSEEYRPNQKKINYLREHIKDYSIVVFLGTWCTDSHDLVPRLQKVLQHAGYPIGQVVMYGTDRAKKTKAGDEKKYKVTLVPTVILYKGDREAGRIIENALKNVETDLADIIEVDLKR